MRIQIYSIYKMNKIQHLKIGGGWAWRFLKNDKKK